jgi:signal transduction histidine kinase
MPTEANETRLRENRVVAQGTTSRLMLAAAVVAVVTGTAAGFWIARNQASLPPGELLRLEELAEDASTMEAATAWTFEVLRGSNISEDDLAQRFGEPFSVGQTVEGLNQEILQVISEFGPVHFLRFLSREDGEATALGLGDPDRALESRIIIEDGVILDWWVSAHDLHSRLPAWHLVLAIAGGWMFAGAALLARGAARHRLVSWLAAGAIASVASVLVLSDVPVLYAVGRSAPALLVPIALLTLFEACRRRARLWMSGLAAASSVLLVVAVFMVDPARVGHPEVFLLADDPEASRLVVAIASVLASAALAGGAVTIGKGASMASLRRDPVVVLSLVILTTWTVTNVAIAADALWGGAALLSGPLTVAVLLVVLAVPVAAGIAATFSRWESELAGVVVDVEAGESDLQTVAARALDDPSLRLLRWSDAVGGWMNSSGQSISEEELSRSGREQTRIQAGEETVAVIEHDASVLRRPQRLRAVAAAVGMALEVQALNAQALERLAEVQASRARIVESADVARRRIERDLHDGAQQRLVALGMLLQQGEREASRRGETDMVDLFDRASTEVRAALSEIRDVSHGALPALLAERGLAVAIEALAERSPVETRTRLTTGRFDPMVEQTSYYLVAEALTNVAKHSRASAASVEIQQTDHALRVSVVDNGVGGASVAAGTGIQGVADRVAAAGGELKLNSPSGQGTRIEAMLPCG